LSFTSPAHIFCYLMIVILIWMYFENKKKVSALYPFIILILIINDIFVISDFDRFFDYIGILLPLYYFLSSYLLLSFVSFKSMRYKEFFTPSILIALFFIIYLTFSVLNLLMPNLEDSLGYTILILVSLFYYLGCCFIIYLRNLYSYAYYLLIAAICSILVNALVPIQELYYNNSVFVSIVNATDIIAMFFYLKFLIIAEPIKDDTYL